jgi:hypothetical protein
VGWRRALERACLRRDLGVRSRRAEDPRGHRGVEIPTPHVAALDSGAAAAGQIAFAACGTGDAFHTAMHPTPITPAWIIEDLRQRSEEREERQRARLELPVPTPAVESTRDDAPGRSSVIVIDLWS